MPELYLISPPTFELADFAKQLEAAITAVDKGFTTAFQLRLKNASDEQITEATNSLLPICQAYDVAFIMNDRIDLCIDLGCDGVHVGQEDLAGTSIKQVRNELGEEKVLGITCHASKHLAMEAAEAGADYVAFGAFYPTTSKPIEKLEKWGTPTSDILEWWTTYTEIPAVAIGGITPDNCSPLLAADFLAVITAVWEHKDGPAAAIQAFYQSIHG